MKSHITKKIYRPYNPTQSTKIRLNVLICLLKLFFCLKKLIKRYLTIVLYYLYQSKTTNNVLFVIPKFEQQQHKFTTYRIV